MAMNIKRVYMLASDHRWQWEEWCERAGVPRLRISGAKHLVFSAFLAAIAYLDLIAQWKRRAVTT